MADETNNAGVPPTAQGEAPAQGQGNQETTGIQARINELTAGMRQAQERTVQLTQTVATLAAQLAEKNGQSQALSQAPQDPFASVDWSDATSVQKAIVASQQQQAAAFQREITAVRSQMQQSEVGSIAASFGIKDPAIVQYAQQVVAYNQQRGVPFNATDAVRYAAGQAALGQLPGVQPAAAQRFPVNLPGTPPGVQMPVPVAMAPLPANFDDLSLAQQEAILEKRVDGKPF